MLHAADVRYHPIVCALCGRPFYGHRRDTGECLTWQRADPANKPLVYGLRKVPDSAAKWVIR